MRKRNFSFDLPKLKLGAFKYENRPWNDNNNAMAAEPESPGEIPKSVRPLPNDLDAALRAACTGVLRNNKPSHEYHKGGKAQLDYATIRRGGGNNPAPALRKPDPVPTTLSKTPSNEDRAHRPNRDSTMLNGVVSPEMSHRISHVSASTDQYSQPQEDGFQVQVQRSRAQSRVDQLMAGSSPGKAPEAQRSRTDSQHSRSQSTPQGFWTHPPPQVASKFGSVRRPKPAPRAHSMETTASPLNDPMMGNPWSMSPTKANAGDDPAASLPMASDQGLSTTTDTKEGAEAIDAEWMQEDSERQRLLRQQAFADTALSRHATRIESRPEQIKEVESKVDGQEPQMPTPVFVVPERKPVPRAQAVVSPDPSSSLPSPTIASTQGSESPPEQLTTEEEALQVPNVQRSDSRDGRGRTRGNGIPTNSRAVSRARSVTREVKDFIRNASRNASRSRQPRSKTDDTYTRSRRPSISNNVRDFFRPGTATGKPSLDVPRSMVDLKSKSHESFISARSETSPAKDTPMQLSQRSSRHHKNSSNSTGRNSFEADSDETLTRRSVQGAESKRQMDLNRALPPLPRLDSWHAEPFVAPVSTAPDSPKHALDSPKQGFESPRQTLEPPRNPRDSSLPSPTISNTFKHVPSRDSRSPLPSPKLGGVHDYVALRMGAPVSRQVSKANAPRERGNPNLASLRPGMSRRAPTDPREAKAQPSDSGLPNSSHQAKRSEVQANRRRSQSVQEINAPDLSEKLRNASANSPDGRPIHAVGQAKLINTTPSRGQLDGFASKIGRKLSTKRRNITPTQHPPAPPPHRELPERKAKTATSTPIGLSRANSSYHAKKRPDMSRKLSMEEYGNMYDNRFHKDNDSIMAPPPPVAVGSSKNSPRMNLGNFLPNKFQPQQQQHQHQQQHSQQQSGSKKWWHLGLSGAGDNLDSTPRSGSGIEHTNGGLGVRY